MKRALFIALLAALMSGQNMPPVTQADVVGDGVAHAVAGSGTARWISFLAPSSNSTATCGTANVSGCVRIGDASISTSRGTILVPGASAYVAESPGAQRHALSQWFYLVQSGDKLVITYGK